jgi:hypothetical protein
MAPPQPNLTIKNEPTETPPTTDANADNDHLSPPPTHMNMNMALKVEPMAIDEVNRPEPPAEQPINLLMQRININ